METGRKGILEAALALPEAERVRLARQLLASLPPEADETYADELAGELDERLAEFQRDPTGAVPWSELKDQR